MAWIGFQGQMTHTDGWGTSKQDADGSASFIPAQGAPTEPRPEPAPEGLQESKHIFRNCVSLLLSTVAVKNQIIGTYN